jgi:hypothetical protein
MPLQRPCWGSRRNVRMNPSLPRTLCPLCDSSATLLSRRKRRMGGGGSVKFNTAVGAALLIAVQLASDAQQAEPRRIAAAPAFNARQLTAHPGRDWITNGGNVLNQRYSPLTLLDRGNVKDLKALWRTSMGSGAQPNNSGQAQILHPNRPRVRARAFAPLMLRYLLSGNRCAARRFWLQIRVDDGAVACAEAVPRCHGARPRAARATAISRTFFGAAVAGIRAGAATASTR